MRNALFLLLILATPPVQARSTQGPAVPACPTLWSAYSTQVDSLAAAVSAAQARPQDRVLVARVQAIREDLRRALAQIVIAGCL